MLTLRRLKAFARLIYNAKEKHHETLAGFCIGGFLVWLSGRARCFVLYGSCSDHWCTISKTGNSLESQRRRNRSSLFMIQGNNVMRSLGRAHISHRFSSSVHYSIDRTPLPEYSL